MKIVVRLVALLFLSVFVCIYCNYSPTLGHRTYLWKLGGNQLFIENFLNVLCEVFMNPFLFFVCAAETGGDDCDVSGGGPFCACAGFPHVSVKVQYMIGVTLVYIPWLLFSLGISHPVRPFLPAVNLNLAQLLLGFLSC